MIACIGGAHLDRHGVLRGPLVLGTSNPGSVHVAVGGVARNVAENLARLGVKVTLVSLDTRVDAFALQLGGYSNSQKRRDESRAA